MKGLDLSHAFYEAHGKPMLERDFPDLLPHIAVGLMGAGSECLGFDDEASHDHDFEPGFAIFLPGEEVIDRETAFRLERAYAALPKEFMGYRRSRLSPTGGARHGVIRRADFLYEKTGTPDGVLSLRDFLYLPEQALLEATNGALFYDGDGAFTIIRTRLSYLPEDVRRKKLAGELLLAGQAGQYNYPRMAKRGDLAAAQLCVREFVKSCLHILCLLNKVYLPYYKWQFRTVRTLPFLSELVPSLERLLLETNAEDAARTEACISGLSAFFISALRAHALSLRTESTLEAHAYAVNDKIGDHALRNLHILAGV